MTGSFGGAGMAFRLHAVPCRFRKSWVSVERRLSGESHLAFYSGIVEVLHEQPWQTFSYLRYNTVLYSYGHAAKGYGFMGVARIPVHRAIEPNAGAMAKKK